MDTHVADLSCRVMCRVEKESEYESFELWTSPDGQSRSKNLARFTNHKRKNSKLTF